MSHLFRSAAAMLSTGLVTASALCAQTASPIAKAPLTARQSLTVSKAALIGPENCLEFKTSMVIASGVPGAYMVRAGTIVLLHIKYETAAKRAVEVIKSYGFDQQCFVKPENKSLMYWKSAGQVPNKRLTGDPCATIDPTKVEVVHQQSSWRVMGQGNQYAAYGDDKASADRATTLIKAYGFNRRCFIGAPYDLQMTYWLLPE